MSVKKVDLIYDLTQQSLTYLLFQSRESTPLLAKYLREAWWKGQDGIKEGGNKDQAHSSR